MGVTLLYNSSAFAGGNPEKAAALLGKLAAAYPDSIDVKIQLSEAYIKIDQAEDARRLIIPITKAFPSNLLARKIAAKLSVR